jgi:hypothetical protein
MRAVITSFVALATLLACGGRTPFDSPSVESPPLVTSKGGVFSTGGMGAGGAIGGGGIGTAGVFGTGGRGTGGAVGTGGGTGGAFCASQASTGLLVCDDFSTPMATSPRKFLPWNGMPSLLMSVSDGTLVFEKPTAFAASYAVLGPEMDFRDTSIEVTMSAETTDRSLSAVCWGNPSDLISGGLQQDEDALHLHVVVNGNVQARLSASVQTAPGQARRVKMEVRANGSIRCFVDGTPVLSTTQDLSKLPPTLAPGINADSYPPAQRFTFDDFMVRRLAQP